MAIYHRTFFDLNGKRGYCVDGAEGLPPDTITDLKISVPDRKTSIRMTSLFLRGETVRIVFVAVLESGTRPVAVFNSDRRSMLRIGFPYPLTPLREGYGGLIAFGEGIRNDLETTGSLPVSEECLTRFEPSAIPYVSLTCDSVKLTGEVRLGGGDPARLVSDGVDVPEELLGTNRALRLVLLDTGSGDSTNPMIATANGVNAYFGTEHRRSPVYKIFGVTPDANGTMTLRFDDHFHFTPVGESDTVTSLLAIGTDLTTDDVCRELNGTGEDNEDETEPACPPSTIQFETIE